MPKNSMTRMLAVLVSFVLVFGQCGTGFAYAAQDGSALQGGSIVLSPAEDDPADGEGGGGNEGDPADPADPADPNPDDPAEPLSATIAYEPVEKTKNATLTVSAEGVLEGEQVTYEWEESEDGGATWPDKTDPSYEPSGIEQSLSLRPIDGHIGHAFRVTVTATNAENEERSVTAEPVVIDYLDPQLKVEATRTVVDWTATLTLTEPSLEEGETCTYRWQKSTDKGTTWEAVEGATEATLAVPIDETAPQLLYRAVVTTSAHRVAMTDSVAPADAPDQLAVTLTQVLDGDKVIISASEEGLNKNETCSYRWQRSADEGKTWTTIEGESDAILHVDKTTAPDGLLVRAVVLTSESRLAISNQLNTSEAQKQTQTAILVKPGGEEVGPAVTTTKGNNLSYVLEVVGDPRATINAVSADTSIVTVELPASQNDSAGTEADGNAGPVQPVKSTRSLIIKPVARKGATTVTITVGETSAFKAVQVVLTVTIEPTGIDRLVADDKTQAELNTQVLQEEYDTLADSGGGTIALPEGTFYFASSGFYGRSEICIRARSNVKLVGAGQDKTILMPVGEWVKGTQYEHGIDMFCWQGIYEEDGEYLTNADFEDFTIDASLTKGSPTGYNAAGKGFYFQLFKNCDWKNVTVKNTDGTGFGVDYPINCTIANCRAEGCGKNTDKNGTGASGFGIGTGYSEDESMIIRNCVALNNTKYGFFFEHQSLFESGHVRAEGAQLFWVRDCTASGNLYNFGGERAHDMVFENCRSEQAEDAAREKYTLFAFRLGNHTCRTAFVDCEVSQGLSMRGGDETTIQAAIWAHSENVIDGPSGYVVDLDAMIPRSEAAELIWRTYGRPDPIQIGGEAKRLFPYRDVKPGGSNADVASWCVAYQTIVPSDFPGFFFPTRACSLAELLYMAWSGAGSPQVAQVQIGESYAWAEYALGWAFQNGLVSVEDIFTKAGTAVTRGQALEIMRRLSKTSAACEYKATLYKEYDIGSAMPDEGFSDVPDSHWVVKEGWLEKVVVAGIMQGYTDDKGNLTGKFGPDAPVLRGQLATILYRYAHPLSTATTDVAAYEENTTPFVDCESGQYYTAAINWAYRIGIMTGDTGTDTPTVRPHDGITREEAATMLYRYAKLVGPVDEGEGISFSAAPDADLVSSWARTAMSWCYTYGVMTGDSRTGRLNPQSGATRAHIAKMSSMALGV